MTSWKTPRWHGECVCGEVFEENTVKATNAAMGKHQIAHKGHETGWVCVCGCGERFGPGQRSAVTKLLKAHLAERDFEPLALLQGSADE